MPIFLYEHNRQAYDAALSMLSVTGKAAIVHPTGTGKSFIGFKLCEDHPTSVICWLSPSEHIFKTQLENLAAAEASIPENIRFFTYAKLMFMSDEQLADIQPDYIILDEFHRCGAQMWGKGVQTLLSLHEDVPLLGLSATNIRYLDSCRDMTDELFDGHIASKMTLGDAAVRGILNPPTYVTALYSYQKDLEKYELRVHNARMKGVREAGERYLEALRRALEKAEGLADIFGKHVQRQNGKYIVFCAGVEHMHEMIGHVPEWFSKIDGNPHVYSAYSSDPETSKAFMDFKADTSNHLKLLFCIDMLNEGIHVDDISGVILFRPTVSPIIYKQQIGRALCAGKSNTPLILDIVDNISNLYSINTIQDEMNEAIDFYRYIGKSQYIVNETFRVVDEVHDCKRLFDELEDTLSASWDVMYAQAKQYYEENGDLLPPHAYITEEGNKLGQWVIAQRTGRAKNKLSARRIQRLDDIGMSWQTQKERFWEACFHLAEVFFREHGHLRITAKHSPRLAKWIIDQRKKYRDDLLTDEQYQRLTKIGMVWEPEDKWAVKFEAARAFYVENGHLDIPATHVTADGITLGAWYRGVRQQFLDGTLARERIAQLEEIGIEWVSIQTRIWMQHYELAKRYRRQHGDLNVSLTYTTTDGVRLGTWISGQRHAFAKGKLPQKQIDLLDQIDMSWHHFKSRWDTAYSYVEAYHAESGSANVPADYIAPNGFSLGAWVAAQRLKYAAGKLKAKQIERLEQLGLHWNPTDAFWQKGRDYAREYHIAQGHLNVPLSYITEDGFRLGSWINNQRNRYKQSLLSREQIEQLEQIGMVWYPREARWEDGYAYARQYYHEKGDLGVPSPYVTQDGFKLGSWIASQRTSYKKGKMDAARVTRLEAIGMIWPTREGQLKQDFLQIEQGANSRRSVVV